MLVHIAICIVDVNAAYLRAARNVLFHDESVLQRFRLTVKAPSKQQKSKWDLRAIELMVCIAWLTLFFNIL